MSEYALTYGKPTGGAACKRSDGCVNEHSPGKVILGQLRLDAKAKTFSSSYHLGCAPKKTCADCLRALGGGEENDDAVARAMEALMEGLRPEHLEDESFVESTRDVLETLFVSGVGSDGLNDDQRAFLESVYDAPMKVVKKRSASGEASSAGKKKSTEAPAKKTCAPAKTTKKRATKAAASKTTTKKRKTEKSEESEEEDRAGDASASEEDDEYDDEEED